ncbi:MAG TPA: tetratricopeptide repeat protein, partial [Anaerolineales bacterium]|nr:tetratricopeptide repeat protein [Anaerolineales bacterium]
WDLTHGHPFLTQQLCSRLWENLYDSDPTGKPTVVPEDVERAIPETLEASRNTLEWLWDGLPPAERVVISALAGAGNRAISQPQLEQLLRESGVRVVIRELQNAPQLLQDWDLIEPSDGGYRFRVELFREWILEHKPLSRVQEELDRIEPLAENLYQAAYGFFRNNQLEDAMPLLRQAIGLNPNHARSRQLLAEIFLLRGEVDQAVQILQLLYDTQPAIARPRLVQALLLKAEDEADDEKRLPIYQQILLIDPHHPITLQRVTDIQRAAYQREFTQRLTEIQKIEKDKRYREALDLARKLAEKYPDERNWQPDIDRLERKTKLAEDYQRAIGAWNSGDRETALRGLADVIVLEPDYEEATRYLHLVKTGHDPALMMNQLAGEQKAHNRAK